MYVHTRAIYTYKGLTPIFILIDVFTNKCEFLLFFQFLSFSSFLSVHFFQLNESRPSMPLMDFEAGSLTTV